MITSLTLFFGEVGQRIIRKIVRYDFVGGGYLSIAVGCALTIIISSSSITTSLIIPLAAVNTLHLEHVYPLTIGANIGTTFTGVITGFAFDDPEAKEAALVHIYINIIGFLFWYPIPQMRQVPIEIATFLGEITEIAWIFPFIYLPVVFFLYPGIILGISTGFQKFREEKDGLALALSLVSLFIIVGLHGIFIWWWRKYDGRQRLKKLVEDRRERIRQRGDGENQSRDFIPTFSDDDVDFRSK